MKLSEMKEAKICRNDLVGFLHHSDISKLNTLFDDVYKITSKDSFYDLCDQAINAYSNKQLSNKIVSEIFDVLTQQNKSYRIESHRYAAGSIFEYDADQRAYLFLKKGTRREFNSLNTYI